MKHLASLAGAALALTLAAAPATAAPYSGHGGNQAQHRNDGSWKQDRSDKRGEARRGNQRRDAQNDKRGNRNWRGNDNRRDRWTGDRNQRRNQADNRNPRRYDGDNRKRNDWQKRRNPNARADWRSYRRNLRSAQRYRIAKYRAPANYHYRRWSYGQFLPFEYRARPYWLTNFVLYGLFAPPPGLVWVRYGDDALLVDIYTGEIVQVRYDIFYW